MRRLWISFDLYFFVHVASQFTIHRPRSETTWRTSGVTQVSRNFVCLLMTTSLHRCTWFKYIQVYSFSPFWSSLALLRFPRLSPGVDSAPGLDAAARKLNSIWQVWHQIFMFYIVLRYSSRFQIRSNFQFWQLSLRCIRQLFWISVEVQKLRISHGEGHRHRRR